MQFQNGMVGGDFPMGVAAMLYILFGLTVIAVVIYLQRNSKNSESANH